MRRTVLILILATVALTAACGGPSEIDKAEAACEKKRVELVAEGNMFAGLLDCAAIAEEARNPTPPTAPTTTTGGPESDSEKYDRCLAAGMLEGYCRTQAFGN